MTGGPGAVKEAGPPFGDLLAAACGDALPEREGPIVGRRYGLDGGGWQTLRAVGESLDRPISRERVRQIIDRALPKLKTQGTRQRSSGCSTGTRYGEALHSTSQEALQVSAFLSRLQDFV